MAQFIPADPFDLVIFGGTGDLSQRKLLPALFHRDRDGQFSDGSRIFALSRGKMSRDEFVGFVRKALERHLDGGEIDDETWQRFSQRLRHYRLDVTTPEGWEGLGDALEEEPEHIRVFYLATLPSLYGTSASCLAKVGLIAPEAGNIPEARKFGRDLPCPAEDQNLHAVTPSRAPTPSRSRRRTPRGAMSTWRSPASRRATANWASRPPRACIAMVSISSSNRSTR